MKLSMPSPPPPLIVFVLHLLFCSSSLSSSVSAAVVIHLPGFPGPLPFHLETGYVNVDEEKGAELFYYFTRSERNPGEAPFLIWLSGGPGCSSANGLLFELGPFEFVHTEYKGGLPSLKYRPFNWAKIANIIFIDSPVGAGFSYSIDEIDHPGDLSASHYVHTFILKWFKARPEYISNPLYIAGDSYGGKVVPVVTQLVARGIESGKEPLLNLKGYIIGNPATGEKVDINSRVPFAHGMGLISDELAQSIERSCKGQDHLNPQTAECSKNLEIFETFIDELNHAQILEPRCPLDHPLADTLLMTSSEKIRSLRQQRGLLDPPPPDLSCRQNYISFLSYYWANNKATRKALHIRKGTIKEWMRCHPIIAYDEDVPSNLEYQFNLTTKGHRALIISGDHDLIVPFIGTYKWIKSLNFSVMHEWRSWHVRDQVAGYTILYSNNLTFATVKGAGHMAVGYKVEECLNMFERWISYQPL